MDRRNYYKSAIAHNLDKDNAEAHVEVLLGRIQPEHLIGDPEDCADFNQTLQLFKQEISERLPRFTAAMMLDKIDQGVAAKHYDAVMSAVSTGEVTGDLIESIRQVPVSLSPVQKNIDALREEALAAQRKARTTVDKVQQPQLQYEAEILAKVAVSYGADTPVVKAGMKVINGAQYNLQKLAETDRDLPKHDDGRRDVAGVIQDAYGKEYALRESRKMAEKARVAIAGLATAAVLSSVPNVAAAANETAAVEVLPDNPNVNNKPNVLDKKAVVSLDKVKESTNQIEQRQVEAPKEQAVQPEMKSAPAIPAVGDKAKEQQASVNDKGSAPSDAIAGKKRASSGGLAFKVPSARTTPDGEKVNEGVVEKAPQEVIQGDAREVSANPAVTRELDKVEAVLPPMPEKKPDSGNNAAGVLADTPDSIDSSLDNEQAPAISNAVQPEKNTPSSMGTNIEVLPEDSIIRFKIPRERKTSEGIESQIKIQEETYRPRFSLNKEKKNPGVQADTMPDDFSIIPIPVVPPAAPEAPVPAPAPEQAPNVGSDFSQAAQKMAERGGVWERRGIAMKFFIDEVGLTPSQAAGFVGNLLAETGADLNPGRNQSGGPAFGIAQWEGGRLMDLGAFAGKNQADFMTQLQFIKYELNGKELTAFNAIKTAQNRKDAAIIVRKMYERPGIPHEEKRIAFADEVGDAFNKEYQALLASRMPAPAETKPSGMLAGWPSSGQDAMKLFNQCDPSWGEIKTPLGIRACEVSCGPTSVAMAVNALTDREVNPGEVIRFTNNNKMWLPGDQGTSFDGVINLGKNFGINGRQLQNFKDINAYKEVLQSGGMVLVAGSGPVPFVSAPRAHFVLIRGITEDGKFLVADPYPKTPDTNEKAWDANQIINGTFGAVVFTK